VRADGGLEPAAPGHVFAPGANAHMALPVGDTLVLAPFLGADAVFAYAADAATGALTSLGSTRLAAGAGPRHVCVSPDGATAYVINELDLTLTSFDLAAPSSAAGAGGEGGAGAAAAAASPALLSAPQTLPLLPSGVPGPVPGVSGAHVVASPDGRHVYASVRGPTTDTSGVAVYATAAAVGGGGCSDGAAAPRLTWVGWETAGGDVAVPRDFALSPDGTVVVVASQATDSVVVLARDAATGGLSKLRTTRTPGAKPCFVGWVAL
jgi:6-phosphogluconolactonase